MFLMLSDIHFDPFQDDAVIGKLGAKLREGCHTSGSTSFSRYGSDTNYPLLKSALENAAAAASDHHFHYDYIIITGDYLAHQFDRRYQQCIGGSDEAYRRFASGTIVLVSDMIARAFPGVPVFAALGNNDSDRGDYEKPSESFFSSVGHSWETAWGDVAARTRSEAEASFEKAGYYALPHPTVPGHELLVLNSNLWAAAHHPQACSETDSDPDGQFAWLSDTLDKVARTGGSASLIMHILPGIDAIRSAGGQPVLLWNDRCTQKLMTQLNRYPGVIREIYAGHIHRDDFRVLEDIPGRALCAIHVVPSVSPVYFNNPALEIGWYSKSDGALWDYAALSLNLSGPKPTWETEYVFTQAYGYPRLTLNALEDLSRRIRSGNPASGVGKIYTSHYTAGVDMFLTPQNWLNYSCAQTEITIETFERCTGTVADHRP